MFVKTRCRVRLVGAAACVIMVGVLPVSASASALLPVGAGAADIGLNGANIAAPLTPSGALFANPAGLCAFEGTVTTASLGAGFGSETINGNSGYSEKNDFWAAIPDLSIAIRGSGRWHFGMGMYGSIGTNYDFPADTEAGVPNDFHSETSIMELPLAVGYRVSDRLQLGGELILSGGHLRNRYTLGDQEFRYTLRGPGVQAMFGLIWKPADHWSVGLGVRVPGFLWMDGSTLVPAGTRRDVDLRIELPSRVSLGVMHELTSHVNVYASARWTDSSSFGDSIIEFDGLAQGNVPFVPAATDEWRGALALQFKPTQSWWVRAGVSHSDHVVGKTGVSPLLFDNRDTRVSLGLGIQRGAWAIDTTIGYVFHETREVEESEALIFPGDYETSGALAMLGLTRTH